MGEQSNNELYSRGFNELRNGRVLDAVQIARGLISNDWMNGWVLLGGCFETGSSDFPRDLLRAMDCYERACHEVDTIEASLGVGRIAMQLGTPEAYRRAFSAYEDLVANGRNRIAVANLGRLKCSGKGTAQDVASGRDLLLEATEAGLISARRWLSGAYYFERRYSCFAYHALIYVGMRLFYSILDRYSPKLREY